MSTRRATHLLISCPDRPGIVARVSHRHSTKELAAIGCDIEQIVLPRAVGWHLQDRVIVHENRTVVF